MSPLSVAQFLKPGSISFDLLVVDEASQIEPVDASDAVARCRQMVVVGDERQLPPTRFFAKLTGNDEETGRGRRDHLSGEGCGEHPRSLSCQGAAAPDAELALPKQASVADRGIEQAVLRQPSLHRAEPIRCGCRNGTEVQLQSRCPLRSRKHSRESKGGADRRRSRYSACPRDAGQEPGRRYVLGGAAPGDPERTRASEARTSGHRGVFRTRIPASRSSSRISKTFRATSATLSSSRSGYGRTKEGFISMSFGPLNSDGGERRLNVLISRAKLRCEVFSSITGDDIDLSRAQGTRRRGSQDCSCHLLRPDGLASRRKLVETLTRSSKSRWLLSLAALGYDVKNQIGTAGFFVDLAVADREKPGRFVLGIECDGAQYHSSRSARDRDRLRQNVLEAHGWVLHRIWSTDWFLRPEEETAKVVQAIEAAKVTLARDR